MGLAQLLPMTDQSGWVHDLGWLVMHPAWGVGFFVLVNYAVAAEQQWQLSGSRTPRLIPTLASVGLISYSLYLTHSFVLMHWYWFGFTKVHVLTISLLILTPLSVAFAWLFFRVFERPFMTSTAARVRSRSENAAVVEDGIALAREVA